MQGKPFIPKKIVDVRYWETSEKIVSAVPCTVYRYADIPIYVFYSSVKPYYCDVKQSFNLN